MIRKFIHTHPATRCWWQNNANNNYHGIAAKDNESNTDEVNFNIDNNNNDALLIMIESIPYCVAKLSCWFFAGRKSFGVIKVQQHKYIRKNKTIQVQYNAI